MKTRILLVEDDPALRKLLKEALPESIFVIDIAETGRGGSAMDTPLSEKLREAFERRPDPGSLLLDSYPAGVLNAYQSSWRKAVVKAIALGADAIAVGRLYCYALAAEGDRGVHRLLEILEQEVMVAMALAA